MVMSYMVPIGYLIKRLSAAKAIAHVVHELYPPILVVTLRDCIVAITVSLLFQKHR